MGLVSNCNFLLSVESAWFLLSQHVLKTRHRIKSLVYAESEVVQGIAMVSEVVAARSKGSEKTVNLVKLNSSLSRQR